MESCTQLTKIGVRRARGRTFVQTLGQTAQHARWRTVNRPLASLVLCAVGHWLGRHNSHALGRPRAKIVAMFRQALDKIIFKWRIQKTIRLQQGRRVCQHTLSKFQRKWQTPLWRGCSCDLQTNGPIGRACTCDNRWETLRSIQIKRDGRQPHGRNVCALRRPPRHRAALHRVQQTCASMLRNSSCQKWKTATQRRGLGRLRTGSAALVIGRTYLHGHDQDRARHGRLSHVKWDGTTTSLVQSDGLDFNIDESVGEFASDPRSR